MDIFSVLSYVLLGMLYADIFFVDVGEENSLLDSNFDFWEKHSSLYPLFSQGFGFYRAFLICYHLISLIITT